MKIDNKVARKLSKKYSMDHISPGIWKYGLNVELSNLKNSNSITKADVYDCARITKNRLLHKPTQYDHSYRSYTSTRHQKFSLRGGMYSQQ